MTDTPPEPEGQFPPPGQPYPPPAGQPYPPPAGQPYLPPGYGAPAGPPGYDAPQQPYGYPPAQNVPGPYQGGMPGAAFPDNKLGVWSMILGILSLVCCGLGALPGIAAIILAVQARQRVANGTANNGGMATAGLIMGAIGVVFSVIVFIFFASRGFQLSSSYSVSN